MVLDDLEAIANGTPPQRMQPAEPELAPRLCQHPRQGARGRMTGRSPLPWETGRA